MLVLRTVFHVPSSYIFSKFNAFNKDATWHDDFDIADPSSTQDACHTWTLYMAQHATSPSVPHSSVLRASNRCTGDSVFFLCSITRDMLITSFISSPSLKFNIFLYIWHLVNTDTFYARPIPPPPPPFPGVCVLTGFDCICTIFQEVNHHKLFLLTTVYILQTWRKMHHSYSISCADYKNGDYPKIYNDQVQSRNHVLTQAGKKTKTNLN